jgi:triphosphoribosyl-dephospho-CoA synthase
VNDASLVLAQLALRALHTELALAPKPGLVTPCDNGSHRDMSARTFMLSLAALRHYFRAIAAAGARDADFSDLQRLGLAAEARMLHATGGINTHRGAIFSLGLLAAGAAWLRARGHKLSPANVCHTVRERWGEAIALAPRPVHTHGALVRQRHGAKGAREEAAGGFPSILRVALPALEQALAGGLDERRAQVQTLLSVMSTVVDTNLLYRGGITGLGFTQSAAKEFLAQGGAATDDWRERVEHLGRALVARGLSPGGSADLLAGTWYLHLLKKVR